MNISVHTSLFNYTPEKYNLIDAFTNWGKYCNEIVIATFTDQEKELADSVTKDYFNKTKGSEAVIRIVSDEDIKLEDPLFDGKLKNLSLRASTNEIVIQQDFDERIGGAVELWELAAGELLKLPMPTVCQIPVIDLYRDLDHYKSVGAKWYLTKKEGVYRGPVAFAKRDNGTIDTDKSDTCEPIDHKGDLLPQIAYTSFLKDFNIKHPHIIHLGYLDLEKRIENNKFWGPVWSARNGKEVEVATDLETLDKENEAKAHNLGERWWE